MFKGYELGANYYMTDHKGGRMDIVQTMDGIMVGTINTRMLQQN
jgi:hypothetical protein